MTSNKNFYTHKKEEMILRDFLATDRTALANERTFLAYVRTALSISVAGIGFIKLFDMPIIHALGYIFIPLGLLILFIGIYRFIKVEHKLRKIKY